MNEYVLASSAALGFGVASALQHRAAHAVPLAGVGPIRLALRLLRNRMWLMGRVADTTAVVLQALALRVGSLVVVQSVVACGVIAAISLSAAMDKRLPRRREVIASAIVVIGVFMIGRIAHANPDAKSPSLTRWIELAAVLAAFALIALVAIRSEHARRITASRALILGTVAGACFATGSAFLKIGSIAIRHHGTQIGAIAAIGGFVAMGIIGNVFAQRGFQIGTISTGLSALIAAEPIAALIAGIILLDEHIAKSARGVIGLCGLIVLAVGVAIAAGIDRRHVEPPAAATSTFRSTRPA